MILLPSRAPELNPVENIWQYLRQNWLSNRVFDTYEDIIDAACAAWRKLIAKPETITSIAPHRSKIRAVRIRASSVQQMTQSMSLSGIARPRRTRWVSPARSSSHASIIRPYERRVRPLAGRRRRRDEFYLA